MIWCGTEAGSACSPEKVVSSRSRPRRGAGEAVQCGGRLHREKCWKASKCYLRGGRYTFIYGGKGKMKVKIKNHHF